jgi:hypothetical protein
MSRDTTRREALRLIGLGAAAVAMPSIASPQAPTFPKGAIIRTLFKDMAPEELAGGATLFHEHLSLGTDFNQRFTAAAQAARALNGPGPAPLGTPPAPPRAGGAPNAGPGRGTGRAGGPPPAAGPNPMSDPTLMAQELTQAKAEGVACIVDAGHPDSGRDINFLRQASMLSGLPVVAGGGFYAEPWYPKELATMSEDDIVKALMTSSARGAKSGRGTRSRRSSARCSARWAAHRWRRTCRSSRTRGFQESPRWNSSISSRTPARIPRRS